MTKTTQTLPADLREHGGYRCRSSRGPLLRYSLRGCVTLVQVSKYTLNQDRCGTRGSRSRLDIVERPTACGALELSSSPRQSFAPKATEENPHIDKPSGLCASAHVHWDNGPWGNSSDNSTCRSLTWGILGLAVVLDNVKPATALSNLYRDPAYEGRHFSGKFQWVDSNHQSQVPSGSWALSGQWKT